MLVAAPTGAGKTIVGEFAVHLALREGRKCFYTAPIKALSNQKFHDLVARYGADKVGLLTGDNTVNGEAPVVVMTTEVLRNMLYAGSHTLQGLSYVVMDEVHYLADRFRGAVWEEVIIHLPEHVAVVALSATVSNAEEFGEWLGEVRGDTRIVVEEHRPVPLWQHVMAGPRLYDLFVDDEQTKVNPELVRLAREDDRMAKMTREAKRDYDHRSNGPRPARGGRRPRGINVPLRFEMVERLNRDKLLPAITFIFSRVGCAAAVDQCLAAGLRLTSNDERLRIREIVEERCADLPQEDLAVLGYGAWLDGLERGFASHHAGHAAHVQGDGRGAVPAGPGQDGLRHRDPRAGHQHAGAHRRAREAREVERREPRRDHAGGVHPAHRTSRPSRHRHRGQRGRGVAPGLRPVGARRSRLDAHLSAALVVQAVVQHGRQPRGLGRPPRGARAARDLVRAVPGRPRGGRDGAPGAQARGGHRRLPRGDDLPPRRLRGVRRAAAAAHRPREGARPRRCCAAPIGRRRVAGRAQARRRHRGADRSALRRRGRDRPRPQRARGAAPDRAAARPPGEAAVRRRLPGARRAAGAHPHPEAVQPALGQLAARPRRQAQGRRRRRARRPAPQGALGQRRGRGRARAAPTHPPAPLPRLRRPRAARPVGRALPAPREGDPRPRAPRRDPHQLHRPPVRPRLRDPRRAWAT